MGIVSLGPRSRLRVVLRGGPPPASGSMPSAGLSGDPYVPARDAGSAGVSGVNTTIGGAGEVCAGYLLRSGITGEVAVGFVVRAGAELD